MYSMEEIEAALQSALQLLGFKALKEHQKQVITKFVLGSDVFVNLPTGSGKSLCYWMLPATFNFLRQEEGSFIIVVSPLVALMKDQVKGLARVGVSAIATGDVIERSTLERIHRGKYQIIFFSPEGLLQNLEWRDVLQSPTYQERLVAFVIDEAHCVKDW